MIHDSPNGAALQAEKPAENGHVAASSTAPHPAFLVQPLQKLLYRANECAMGSMGRVEHRFTGDVKCPVCGGTDNDPRGEEFRCYGFQANPFGDQKTEQRVIHCTSEAHAAGLQPTKEWRTYKHNSHGRCGCGVEHAPDLYKPRIAVINEALNKLQEKLPKEGDPAPDRPAGAAINQGLPRESRFKEGDWVVCWNPKTGEENFGTVVKVVANGYRMDFPTATKPILIREKDALRRVGETPGGEAGAMPAGPLVVRADQVESKKVRWLWKNRIPFGFITIFAGRTGIGKSFVALDVAARYSKGAPLEDNDGISLDPGRVLIMSEDPHDFVLRPRLDAMGADLSRIHFMTWEAMMTYKIGDTRLLDKVVEAAEGADLIIIDPPTNFLGDVDEHNNSAVRNVLMKIVAWIQTKPSPPAVVLITQISKGSGSKEIEAIFRVIGSVAWTSTSRVAHTFVPDRDAPKDSEECLFCCPKNNIGPKPKTLRYRVTRGESPIVEWLGESEKTADEAMASPKKEASRREAAEAFLIECFNARTEWSSDELIEEAAKRKISRNAVFEAKKTVGIKSRKVGNAWYCYVMPTWEHFKIDEGTDPSSPY